jgi:hypothetical protein
MKVSLRRGGQARRGVELVGDGLLQGAVHVVLIRKARAIGAFQVLDESAVVLDDLGRRAQERARLRPQRRGRCLLRNIDDVAGIVGENRLGPGGVVAEREPPRHGVDRERPCWRHRLSVHAPLAAK